jgi:hypothetical protein
MRTKPLLVTGRPQITGRLPVQSGRPARRGEGANRRGRFIQPVHLGIVPMLPHQLS